MTFCWVVSPRLNFETWSWNETWPQFISGLVSIVWPRTWICTLYFLWNCKSVRPMTR